MRCVCKKWFWILTLHHGKGTSLNVIQVGLGGMGHAWLKAVEGIL
jgi:hypothetical protein